MYFSSIIPKDTEMEKRWRGEIGKDGLILINKVMNLTLEYGVVFNQNGSTSHCQPRLIQGSSVGIIPFINENPILIGYLPNVYRPIAEGCFDEFPRGFADLKNLIPETSEEAALREFTEETNFAAPSNRFNFLDGPFNMDTAWFCHSEGRGISFWTCEIKKEETFSKQGKILLNPKFTLNKKMSQIEFIPIDKIEFNCGISQLMLMLFKNKYVK